MAKYNKVRRVLNKIWKGKSYKKSGSGWPPTRGTTVRSLKEKPEAKDAEKDIKDALKR